MKIVPLTKTAGQLIIRWAYVLSMVYGRDEWIGCRQFSAAWYWLRVFRKGSRLCGL